MKNIIPLILLLAGLFGNSQTQLEKWQFIKDMIINSPTCYSGWANNYDEIKYVEDDYETLRIKFITFSGPVTRVKFERILDLKNVKDAYYKPREVRRGISLYCSCSKTEHIYCAMVYLNEPQPDRVFERISEYGGWRLVQGITETYDSFEFTFKSEFDRDKFIRYVQSFH